MSPKNATEWLGARFYYEPEEDFDHYHFISGVAVVQFLTEVLTIFHVLYILNIFIPTRCCHIHFKIISCVFLLDLILKAAANIIILSKLITGKTFLKTATDYLIVNIIQQTANYAYYFYPMAIFAERSLSMLWARSYERYFSILLIGTLVFLPIIASIYLTIHLLFLQGYIPIFFAYLFCNIFANSYWGLYFVVYFCSKKYAKPTKVQSLSERYQRYENFRTSKTMFWFGASSLIGITMATVYIQVQWHYQAWFPNISEINMNSILRILIDTGEGFVFLIMPTALTFIHPKLKKKYMKAFGCFSRRQPRHVVATSVDLELGVIKSVTGENLVRKDEQDYYFTTMVTEWEKKFDTITKVSMETPEAGYFDALFVDAFRVPKYQTTIQSHNGVLRAKVIKNFLDSLMLGFEKYHFYVQLFPNKFL